MGRVMTKAARVLHVLPHPGGGGETYVDLLCEMEGYRFEKVFVAAGPRPSPAVLVGGLRAQLASRRCDLLHVHGEVASGLCLPSLAFRPSVVTINGLHLVRRLNGWKRSVAETNLRVITRAASVTICVSDSELGDVRAVVGDRGGVVLVRNGVDTALPSPEERSAARDELDLQPADVVGLYLAALDPHKEPLVAAHAALAAARGGAPVVLLFAGDGPLRSEVEALAANGHTLRVLGFQPEPDPLLAAADFFVLPSRREGLSFALLEAMSRALPVVVSDAPGNTDAVSDAGIVVPSGDIPGFTSAFRRLLDPDERRDLGQRARARVLDYFTAQQMLQATRQIYEDVLER